MSHKKTRKKHLSDGQIWYTNHGQMIDITSVQAMKKSTAHKKIVLVGTYWTGQFSKWRGYYNYPIDEAVEVDPEAYGDICELWLFRGKHMAWCWYGINDSVKEERWKNVCRD